MLIKLMVGLLAVTGCTYAELRPANEAKGTGSLAVEERAGLWVSADSKAWEGSLTVQRELIPVELIVENRSGKTVHFSRADVALVGAEHTVRPVAPEKVDPEPRAASLGLDPATPEFLREEGAVYHTLPDKERPAAEVRRAAIMDGPIAPGEQRRGFVYFDRLPKRLHKAALHVSVRGAPGAQPVAAVDIPFVVER